jgi:hypothetical protein
MRNLKRVLVATKTLFYSVPFSREPSIGTMFAAPDKQGVNQLVCCKFVKKRMGLKRYLQILNQLLGRPINKISGIRRGKHSSGWESFSATPCGIFFIFSCINHRYIL